jgi:hypothetical protein
MDVPFEWQWKPTFIDISRYDERTRINPGEMALEGAPAAVLFKISTCSLTTLPTIPEFCAFAGTF